MPQIPTFDLATIPHAAAQPDANPAAFAAPGAALAQGGAQVSGDLQDWNARYAEARRQADAGNLAAQATQQLGDAQFKWSKVPDRAQALAGFATDAATIRKNVLGQAADPLVQSYVARSVDQETALRNIDTGTAAFGLESNKQVADLNAHLLQYEQQMAVGSPAMRALLTDQGNAAINGAVAGGWLRPEQGEALAANFKSQAAEVGAKQLILTDPQQAAAVLGDPAKSQQMFPGLLPEHAENLAMRAENRAYRMDLRATSAQAHADNMAERLVKQDQAANAATLIAAATAGQSVPADQLATAVGTRRLSASGFEAVLAAQTRAKQGSDTPGVAVSLYQRLAGGQLQNDDINHALTAGDIKGETAVTLTRALGEQQAHGQSDVEKGAFNTLKTALSGGAVEQGIIPDKAPEAQKWASAQQEWLNRVTIGHEDAHAVLGDMLGRYTTPSATPEAWPKPRFAAAPVKSTADADAAAVATAQAFQNGQISEPQMQTERTLINQYYDFYARKEAATAAAANVPKTGGAKVRGLVPGDNQ